MLGHGDGTTVLVVLAPTDQARFCVLDPQSGTGIPLNCAALYTEYRTGRTLMITSMTGFARREASGPWGQLACELRSVNHRYLEAGFRLPEELRSLETELRQALARDLRRGKVDCTLHLRTSQGGVSELVIDDRALANLLTRVREITVATPGKPTVDVMDILRWPGIVREDETDTESLQAAARALFADTLRELADSRAREGVRLRELIEQRCAALEQLVAQVRARLPEIQTRVRQRLVDRVAELGTAVDRERLEQELVLLLQRLDVAEELDRLTGHIEETRRVIGGNEAAGRRLDFLMQELNREANTLSSKSQDLETTRFAVDMKVVIEQMREQVQNIE
jgi:uncharacterized protein (TIGR00255 family)